MHQNSDDDGDHDAAVDLGAGKELVQSQFEGLHTVIGGFVNIAGFAELGCIAERTAVKEPGHQIRCDPVGHDAGQHLIDVEICFEQAGNGAPQRAGQNPAQKGQNPDHRRGDRFRGDRQCHIQRGRRAHQVLSRRTDVEKARLERHRHREPRQDQGRGPEEHIADVGGVKPEGQCTRRTTPGGKQPAKHQADAVPCAGDPQRGIPCTHQQDDYAADDQSDGNGDQRGEDSLGAVLCIQGGNLFFHADSPSFAVRFAPAI